MPGRLEFGMDFNATRGVLKRRSDEPFRILVMGDFSGRDSRLTAPASVNLKERSILPVDLDNFEQRLKQLSPHIQIPLDGQGTENASFQFQQLEDFHPDEIVTHHLLFETLWETRAGLLNPASFVQTAARLREELNIKNKTISQIVEPQPQPVTVDESDKGMLDRLLGDQPANVSTTPTATKTATVDIMKFLDGVIREHIVDNPHPDQAMLLQSIEQAMATLLRQILHHENFQAIESIWRGLFEMITRLELDEQLQLCIMDVSKAELTADLVLAGRAFEHTGCYQNLIENDVGMLGGQTWSLMLGHYQFEPQTKDVLLLARLAELASHTGGPFLSSASDSFVSINVQQEIGKNTQSLDTNTTADSKSQQLWAELRKGSYAVHLGLIYPRYLLRLPYGERTDEIDSISFEEVEQNNAHADPFLWGNAALLSGILLAQGYTQNGWDMCADDNLQLDSLPAYNFEENGEQHIKPCAELLFPESVAQQLQQAGIMPLMSFRNNNAARLYRFQSIANPPTSLMAAWQ